MSVAPQVMGFFFIGQLNVKYVLQATDQPRMADWKDDLDAVAQVAPHEIGAAKINFLGSAIPKIVDSAMFQEPAHNARHPDVVTESIHQRPQATEPPHQQVDFDACLRSTI